MKNRFLKVQEVGDFYKGNTKPQVLLKGNWLEQAGIEPNGRVEIENPKHGQLIITMIERSENDDRP